jgi:hypothetical protein
MESNRRLLQHCLAASTSPETGSAVNSGQPVPRLRRILSCQEPLAATAAFFAGVVLLAACGAQAPGEGPTGTYATDVHGAAAPFNGHWAITYAASGSETVDFNGAEFVQEKASFTKDYVTFHGGTGPHACPAPGKYRWKITGHKLRFTLVSDTCPGRVTTLAHPLTQQG